MADDFTKSGKEVADVFSFYSVCDTRGPPVDAHNSELIKVFITTNKHF